VMIVSHQTILHHIKLSTQNGIKKGVFGWEIEARRCGFLHEL